jgi:hypothetical protein
MVKAKRKALALTNLELRLQKPPFLYSLDDIIHFTDNNGLLLIEQYSQEDLERFIKTKTTESKDKRLPELCVIRGGNNEQLFIYKNRVLPLCAKLLKDARPLIQKAISTRWQRILMEYRKEPAMNDDKAFEKLITKYANQFVPQLNILLADKRLSLIYDEYEHSEEGVPDSLYIFSAGRQNVAPSALFLLKRKEILTEIRFLLPFWYTVPILVAIISFFKGFKKQLPRQEEDIDTEEEEQDNHLQEERRVRSRQIKAAALQYRTQSIPPNYTLDDYLERLENQWRRLLDEDVRKTLVEDVKVLVRNKLQYIMRHQAPRRITVKTIEVLADTIIIQTPSLRELDGQESVRRYIQVYITKLFEILRF